MIFSWLRNRRRRKIRAKPFPEAWLDLLSRHVPFYESLSTNDQDKLRDDMHVFIEEKDWVGIDGLDITDEIRVVIAAQACLLLVGFQKHRYFHNVKSIIVHPTTYTTRDVDFEGVVVREQTVPVAGQAYHRGPVLLSWSHVQHGGKYHEDGRNVVIHEFAHKLDMMDGLVDGTPPLKIRKSYRRWIDVMTREFENLKSPRKKRGARLLDEYGATNPAEFFAVASECFFEQASRMRHKHPELYEILRGYYQQDPAEW